MKILLIGSNTSFSFATLHHLLNRGHDLRAIALEIDNTPTQNHDSLPVIIENQPSTGSLAQSYGIPVFRIDDSDPKAGNTIRHYHPEVIIVSCYGRKIPETILNLPELGSFNLHPSLLPAYRGPVPLFWQFRDGLNAFGATLHRMTTTFDQGPILAQRKVDIAIGSSGQQATDLVAAAGNELIDLCLKQLDEGTQTEQAQQESLASYQSYPSRQDFSVSTSWSARHIYHFMRGTSHWGHAYTCAIGKKTYRLLEAIRYTDQPSPVSITNDRVTFPCVSGTLTARFDLH